MNIDVFTFIGPNSKEYAEILKGSMEYFKCGLHQISYKCVKTQGDWPVPDGWECVAESKNLGHQSENHAEAMHTALGHISSDVVIFVDVDMCLLCKGWDCITIDNLISNGVFGVDYGHWQKIKYRYFPTVFYFAFRRGLLDNVDLNFRPVLAYERESSYRQKCNTEWQELCGLFGNYIKCDTGWRLCYDIRSNGLTGKALPRALSVDGRLPIRDGDMLKVLKSKKEHQCEWHINGDVFATHLQASRSHDINTVYGRTWRWRINKYCEMKGHEFRV